MRTGPPKELKVSTGLDTLLFLDRAGIVLPVFPGPTDDINELLDWVVSECRKWSTAGQPSHVQALQCGTRVHAAYVQLMLSAPEHKQGLWDVQYGLVQSFLAGFHFSRLLLCSKEKDAWRGQKAHQATKQPRRPRLKSVRDILDGMNPNWRAMGELKLARRIIETMEAAGVAGRLSSIRRQIRRLKKGAKKVGQ